MTAAPSNTDMLRSNLQRIEGRIAKACRASGRAPEQVRLVAVTKYTPVAIVEDLVALGHNTLGENRPQQLIERTQQLPRNIEWHLIGQLQRNKVRAVIPHVTMIHSVDSLRLLTKIDQVADELSLQPAVLLQVNVSGEESKSGFTIDEIRDQWPEIEAIPNVHVRGLMTMAPDTEDEKVIRDCFGGLRRLQQELNSRSTQIQLDELSMGMSGDFEIAIEEGATLIRLGSILFEGCGEPNDH